MKRQCAEIAAEIASALMRGPRSVNDICNVVGIHPGKASKVRRYCEQFRASGCARIVGLTPSGAEIYAWQRAIFAEPDADVAPSIGRRRGGAHPRHVVEVDGQRVSLRQASELLGVRHGTLRQRLQRTGSVMLKRVAT